MFEVYIIKGDKIGNPIATIEELDDSLKEKVSAYIHKHYNTENVVFTDKLKDDILKENNGVGFYVTKKNTIYEKVISSKGIVWNTYYMKKIGKVLTREVETLIDNEKYDDVSKHYAFIECCLNVAGTYQKEDNYGEMFHILDNLYGYLKRNNDILDDVLSTDLSKFLYNSLVTYKDIIPKRFMFYLAIFNPSHYITSIPTFKKWSLED